MFTFVVYGAPCFPVLCLFFFFFFGRGVAESGEAERALSPAYLGEIYDNIEARPIEMLLETAEGGDAKDGANPEEEAGDPGAFGEPDAVTRREPLAAVGGDGGGGTL